MVNSTDFIVRLQKIMSYFSLSASAFADKIGVPRSSISHLLTGRNKPSLEFVMKVLSSFPEVDLYWLLNGKGEFPKVSITSSLPESRSLNKDIASSITKSDRIERIIIFYKDGSFKSYNN
jgi:transcriptional regulator with XRE-family HTH domain